MKRLIKDNRGQVLYAVIVTMMFISLLAMIAMGLTLKNYHAAVQKQQHVTDYYAADAAAELIRIGKGVDYAKAEFDVTIDVDGATYTIVKGTVTIVTEIDTTNQEFNSWEVSYHAAQQNEAETMAE